MVKRRFWKWGAAVILVTTALIVALDLRDTSQKQTDPVNRLRAGAAHLESIPSRSSTFTDDVFALQSPELALMEETPDDANSIDLLKDEETVNSPKSQSPSERAQPTELPPLGSVPPVPLLSPDQRRANIDAIRKVYPEATDEQIEFWLEETRGLPSEMIREMLRLRMQIGPLAEAFEPKLLKLNPESKHADVSSLHALREAREIVLQNLVNAEAIGYLRTDFQWVDDIDERGQRTLKIAERTLSTESGLIVATGDPLDFSLTSSLFLQVVKDGRKFVTRYGHLKISADRNLQLAIDGTEIVALAGVLIPSDAREIRITDRGELRTLVPESGEWIPIGQLAVVAVPRPKYLIPAGNSLYSPNERSGQAVIVENEVLSNVLKTGSLELSNVNWDREQELLKRLDWLIDQFTR